MIFFAKRYKNFYLFIYFFINTINLFHFYPSSIRIIIHFSWFSIRILIDHPPPTFTFSFPLLLVYVHLREAIPLFDYTSASNTRLENRGRWGSERTNERDTLIGGQHFVFHDDNCSANWESMIRNSLFSNVLLRYTSLFLHHSFSHSYYHQC